MSFARDLQKLVDSRKQDMDTVAKGALLQIGTFLVMESPVDTGRFRLNWNFNNERIDTRTTPETGSGATPSSRGSSASDKAQGKLKAALQEFKNGNILYMTNNLPYAKPLEYGHSVQTPNGMVRRAGIVFKKMVKDEVDKVK